MELLTPIKYQLLGADTDKPWVEARQYDEAGNPIKWALICIGGCLNNCGVIEPDYGPSHRTEEYLARTRWDSAEEAADFYYSLRVVN